MLSGKGPILVVAPHPDDEVLGVGGTIASLASEGRDVHVVIVTHGDPSMFPPEFIEQGRGEARRAHESLGVRRTVFLDGFPAALLDTVPQASLNAAIKDIVDAVRPELLFVPFQGDLHADHRRICEAALVASRPNGAGGPVRGILAYETLSETNWNPASMTGGFAPNLYVDISLFLDSKLRAMGMYESQLKEFPHERSLGALESLARTRGATVGCEAAEAFVLLRGIHGFGM